jgi:uncharacterized membrane protein
MERREKSSKTILIIFVVFLLWSMLQFLAPLTVPQNSIDDLTGLVGVADNDEALSNIPPPWNAVYSIGDRLCHQRAERSFFINGNQMPFCSRCTAIWLGFVVGLGLMIFLKIELTEKFLLLILLGIIPIGIDGVGQQIGLWESTNIIRVTTGLLTGIVCGVTVGIIIDEVKTIRKKGA